MHPDQNTVTTPAQQPSFQLTSKSIYSSSTYFLTFSDLLLIYLIQYPIKFSHFRCLTVTRIVNQRSKSRDKLRPSCLQVQDHFRPPRERLATQISASYPKTPSLTLFPSIHATVTQNLTSATLRPHMPTTLPICMLLTTPFYDLYMHKYHMRATQIARKVAVCTPFTHPIKPLCSTSRNTFPPLVRPPPAVELT